MDKILAVLQAAGIPFAYDHFAEGEAVDPPFICYLLPGSDNFAADGKVYHKISRVNVELYTDKKDLNAEQKVEDQLPRLHIWHKPVWKPPKPLPPESGYICYQVLFS